MQCNFRGKHHVHPFRDFTESDIFGVRVAKQCPLTHLLMVILVQGYNLALAITSCSHCILAHGEGEAEFSSGVRKSQQESVGDKLVPTQTLPQSMFGGCEVRRQEGFAVERDWRCKKKRLDRCWDLRESGIPGETKGKHESRVSDERVSWNSELEGAGACDHSLSPVDSGHE